MTDLQIINPKRDRSSRTGRSAWYPYYAGFSTNFAETLLASAGLPPGATVLDPWNGSGTTTSAAAAVGLRAIGVDLNPVMTIAAKARIVDAAEKPSMLPLATDIVERAKRHKCESCSRREAADEPLTQWFTFNAALSLRRFEHSIRELLAQQPNAGTGALPIESISDICAFFYVALFRAVRAELQNWRVSNPAWVKRNVTPVDVSWQPLAMQFRAEVESMLSEVADSDITFTRERRPNFLVASSEHIPLRAREIDFVLSSPPYCTRIDYAAATALELAVLDFSRSRFDSLRRNLIGTATVPGTAPPPEESWGRECNAFLERVAVHRSRASSTYYYKNHLQYFRSIATSLSEIARVLNRRGRCALILQDSYYKDVHNDLPLIVCEMAQLRGLKLTASQKFTSQRSMARINPRIQPYRTERHASESVLVFERTSPRRPS